MFQSNCVGIRMRKGHEGKWADLLCSYMFYSLCQARQGVKSFIRYSPSLNDTFFLIHGLPKKLFYNALNGWAILKHVSAKNGYLLL